MSDIRDAENCRTPRAHPLIRSPSGREPGPHRNLLASPRVSTEISPGTPASWHHVTQGGSLFNGSANPHNLPLLQLLVPKTGRPHHTCKFTGELAAVLWRTARNEGASGYSCYSSTSTYRESRGACPAARARGLTPHAERASRARVAEIITHWYM